MIFLIPQLSVPVNVNSMVVSQAVVKAFAIGAISVHTGALPSVRLTLVEQVVLFFDESVNIHVTMLLPLLNVRDLVTASASALVSAIVVAPLTLYLMFVIPQLSVPVNVNSMVVSQVVVNAFAIGAISVHTGALPSVRLTVVEQGVLFFYE